MDALLKIVYLLMYLKIIYVYADCKLSLKDDFGVPSPVFIQNGKFLAPNLKGAILISRSETVQVACTGPNRFIVLGNTTTKSDVLDAKCVENSTFYVAKWKGHFKDIKCNMQPWFDVVVSKETCYGPNKIYRMGYKVLNTFYKVYEVCFDSGLLGSYYATHQISPTSQFIQNGGHRPAFVGGDLFGNVKINQFYKTKSQKDRLDSILGNQMGDKYVTNKQFLSRGHLAPRADFTLHAEMHATFHFANVVPEWQRANAGDWAALEEGLRRRVHSIGYPLTIYSGAHGVLTLLNSNGTPVDVYLGTDENNNPIVPVPLYLFKLVYDHLNKKATAFVTINSPYYNASTVRDLTFCSDICDDNPNYSWLKWRNDGFHSFCCNYEDFVDIVHYLPRLSVEGEFY